MDAIAVANYFIEREQKEPGEHPLDILRLVKLVYLAYGYSLAILDRCIINPRFDKVEAWKLGPVIPSVYHTFKYNKANPITEKGGFIVENHDEGGFGFVTPEIPVDEKDVILILEMVWIRYSKTSTKDIINLLHLANTPWAECYRPYQNVEIPKEMTKEYYTTLVNYLRGRAKSKN